MPGSCESEKNSSSLISSLRKYRFQNKAKQPQGVDTSAQSSSKSNSGSGSTKSVNTPASQKSSSSSYNPLGYRKYENTNTAESLRNIWGKIRASFKNNSTISIIDLTLTVEETKLLKDTVLQQPAISVKWSTSISEHAAKDSNGKLLKIKRMYIHELLKCVADELKSKFSIDINGQLTSEKPPVRTYSRNKPSENTVNQSSLSSLNNNLGDHSQGAMDDYEEFCEKEQCLRKMLQTFPGADIMEAQDILVRCQWDLNKAIIEARNQPLRTARKRGSPGNSVSLTSAPNIANQGTMANSQQTEKDISEEIITLDSSDEDDVNNTMSQLSRLSKSTNNVSSPILPPAKRARRLISTSTSSEDEMTTPAKSPVNVPPPKSHVLPVQQKPTTFLQQQTSVQQKPTTSMQQTSVQSKPTTTVQAPVQKKPALQAPIQQKLQPSVQTPSSAQSSSSSDKTINAPQSLSIKPVSTSSSASSEKASASSAASSEKASASSAAPSVKASASSAVPSAKASTSSMPNLPKGLVLFQVSDLDDLPKKLEETPLNGNASNIPPNTSKSAQLIRIKTSNKVTVSSSPSSPAVASSSSASIASVSSSKTVNIPMGKGVSLTPVNQTANVTKNNPKIKTLSITPVNSASSKDSSLKAKSPSNSSEEEESSSTEKSISNEQKNKSKIVNEANGKEILPEADECFELVKKKKGRHRKHEKNSGKRKRFSSDDDDEEEYGNEDIYDSEDSDCEENLTSAHSAVLKFFQEASPEELGSIPGCSKKKMEAITNLRPFSKWIDLVEKLRNDKGLSTDLLNGAKKVLDMRNAITKLMTKCQRISLDMEDLVENLKENKETSSDYVSKQPELLNERMHLTAYQMLGLNWLLLMHNQEVNAILADEMGLGKTVQAISFLAYLKQIQEEGPHLIVVPSSTLDNWRKELETWWPSVSVICYHGSQESRRELRMQILNDEVEEFDIMITTYNMVTSSAEDRMFFKRLEFNYVVFDEAHMLKNMASQRYTNLMRIKAPRRLLLTGTPLQNNLVELMSLLIFAMPHMFSGKIDQIKQMFSCVSKTATGNRNTYEKDRVEHAKRIMKPFVLRRLKRDVLKELPQKHDETRYCPMVEDQAKKYEELITKFTAQVESNEEREKDPSTSGAGMMMQLRRAANHPLLLRRFYDDEKLLSMSKLMLKEPTHSMSDPNIIFEDMAVMSDFELHKLCRQYKSLNTYALPDSAILNSGKLKVLEELLPDLIKEDHRILLFSQFTMVLDIIQEYMNIKNFKFLRLDGQVPVPERQQLIDEFNNDPEILFFLLSTKAGGLGINLTAADTVVLHDIDFNPYNDKQAEDRCHRVGQVRDVRVIRMISEKTIEEGILQRATEKLKLEKDIHDEGDNEENDTASVAMLLRDALGLKPKS